MRWTWLQTIAKQLGFSRGRKVTPGVRKFRTARPMVETLEDRVTPTTNDPFANAFVLSGSNPSDTGTNVSFTGESGEPNNAGVSAPIASAWWQWTAPGDGSVEVNTIGSDFDTTLGVYTGATVNALTSKGEDDDFYGSQSGVFFAATSGTTYYISVAGYSGAEGTIQLALIETPTASSPIDVGGSLAMSVNEGTAKVIDSTMLSATSPSGDMDNLIVYTVTSGPSHGDLFNTDLNSTVTSFTQDDINQGIIEYRNDGMAADNASDTFTFDVADATDLPSVGNTFDITSIDEAPAAFTPGTGFSVNEGTSHTITLAEFGSTTTDPGDPPSEIAYTITTLPLYGSVQLYDTGSDSWSDTLTFTQQDILDGHVRYNNIGGALGGGGGGSDSFSFEVQDDNGTSDSGAFSITVNEGAANVDVNTRFSVNEGATHVITAAELSSSADPGDPPSEVVCTITTPPEYGTVQLYDVDSDSWSDTPTFTQQDILDGYVRYVSSAAPAPGTEDNDSHDSFDFSVQDDDGTPDTGTVNITVNEAQINLDNNNPLSMAEGTTATIDNAHLSAHADPGDPASEVVYTVTSGPSNGYLQNTFTGADHITSFTQDDIDNGYIQYVNTEAGSDSFDYSAQDDNGAPATDTFTINVSDAPLHVTAGPAFSATEGAMTDPVVVAYFTDANPGDHTSDFSVVINWGDSSGPDATSGLVSFDFDTGVYTVTGTHQYDEEGHFAVSVRITDDDGFAVDTSIGLNAAGAVVTSDSVTPPPGVWYPDRYPPHGFTPTANGILESIDAADEASVRPPEFSSHFYDFQGRKYDLAAGTTFVGIDLTVPSAWSGLLQEEPSRPDRFGLLGSLWVGSDVSPNIIFAISFNNESNANTGGFQVFDQNNGWTDAPGFTGYNQTYQLSIGLEGTSVVYFVNGQLVYTDSEGGGTSVFPSVFLQGYNVGHSYDISWSNIGATAATVADAALHEVSFTPPTVTESQSLTGVTVFNLTDDDPNATSTDYYVTVQTGDGNTFNSADDPDVVTVVSDGGTGFNVQLTYTYGEESTGGTFSVQVIDNGDGRLIDDPSNSTIGDSTGGGGTTLGVDFAGSPGGASGPSFWNLGFEFHANSNVTVTALGDYDFGGDGFSQDQQVGLWTNAGDLLASTFVSNADPLTNGHWRFHAITPVTLVAGQDYVVGAQGGEGYVFFVPLNVDPNITYLEDRQIYIDGTQNDPLEMPTVAEIGTDPSFAAFFGGNLAFGGSGFSVADAPLTAGTLSVPTGLKEGDTITDQVIFDFTDADLNADVNDYTAVVTPGDGTGPFTLTSTPGPNGQIVATGDGGFDVQFTHTYAEEVNAQTFSVQVFDNGDSRTIDDPSDATTGLVSGTISVADPAVIVTGVAVDATEGTDLTGVTVATFTDPGGAEPADGTHYTATIDWGDNTTSPGVISFSGTPGSTTDQFTVTGDHTYAEEGNYTVTTTISHEEPLQEHVVNGGFESNDFTGWSPSWPSIGTTPHTGTYAAETTDANQTMSQTIATTAGTTYTFSFWLSSFSPSPQYFWAYWGDTSLFDGALFVPDGMPYTVYSFTVTATGPSTVISFVTGNGNTLFRLDDVSVTAPAPGASATSTAAVADPAVIATGVAVSDIEGQFTGVTVATFTDPGGAESTDDYSALIDWGDNTSSPATIISFAGTLGSTTDEFTVFGNHQYAEEGTYTVTTRIFHEGANAPTVVDAVVNGGFETGDLSPWVNVTTSGITGAAGIGTSDPHSGTYDFEIQSYNPQFTLGHLDQEVPTVSGNTYNISIWARASAAGTAGASFSVTWGGVSAGPTAIVPLNGAYVLYTFSGMATSDTTVLSVSYSLEYDFGAGSTILFLDDISATTSIPNPTTTTSTATVADAALHPTGVSLDATEGLAFTGVTVATFTDPGGAEPNSFDSSGTLDDHYSAIIDWGDNTTSPGFISYSGSPGSTTAEFTVKGDHTYAEEGSYTVSTTVFHEDPAIVDGVERIVNGGFETGLAPWGIDEYYGPSFVGSNFPHTGANELNLGNPAYLGQLTQTVATEPGGTYTISLWVANPNDVSGAGISVEFDGVSLGGFGVPTGGYVQYSFTGTASTNSTLLNIHYDAPGYIYMDDVSVVGPGPNPSPGVTVTSTATVAEQAVVIDTETITLPNASEGQDTGTLTVATFTDPAGGEDPNNYVATIDWGDGTTPTLGNVIAQALTVNIYDGYVSDGGGAPFSNLFGSFNSPDIQFGASTGFNWAPLGHSQDNFGADITGAINVAADGTYSFDLTSDDGSQLYIDGNLIVDNGGDHGASTASGSVFLTAGVHSLEVQFFEDSGSSGVDLTLPAGVSYVTSLAVTGSHAYAEESAANHANSQPYHISVSINHEGVLTPATGFTQTASITIDEVAAVASAASAPFSATEASPSTVQTIATFTDPGNPSAPFEAKSEFSVQVDWGDGNGFVTDAGVSISDPDSNGVYTVTGSHLYAEEAGGFVKVKVFHEGTTSNTASTLLLVADPQLTNFALTPQTALAEGTVAGPISIGTFTDPAGAEAVTSGVVLYGATGGDNPGKLYRIDPTSGAVTLIGSIGFGVTGMAVQPSTGILYGVTTNNSGRKLITINPTTGVGTLVGSLGTNRGVTDIAFDRVSGVLYGWTRGDPAGDNLVKINLTTGAATRVGNSGFGQFNTYGDGLDFSLANTLFLMPEGTGNELDTVNTTTGAVTHVATLSNSGGSGNAINAAKFDPTTGTLFATLNNNDRLVTINTTTGVITDIGFTVNNIDAIAFANGGTYTATISWGDGTPFHQGTVTHTTGNNFQITDATHTFAEEGNYTLTVRVQHESAAPLTLTQSYTVAETAVTAVKGPKISAVEGGSTNYVLLAAFTDPGSTETLGEYDASVDWGDLTTADNSTDASPNIFITQQSPNHYLVQGTHDYAEESPLLGFTVTTTIHHHSEISADVDTVVTQKAVVTDPSVSAAGGFHLAADAGVSTGTQTVATFTDPAGPELIAGPLPAPGEYVATIDWGDTNNSTGTISYDGAKFVVKGSHIYADHGTYTIGVLLQHGTSSNVNVTSTAVVTVASNPTVAVNIVAASLRDSHDTSNVTFTFSEAPGASFVIGDAVTVGGTLSSLVMDTPTTYHATFTATNGFSGTGKVTVNAGSYTDAAGNPGAMGADTVVIFAVTLPAGWVKQVSGDFNGDGKADIAAYYETSTSATLHGGNWLVCLSTGTGFMAPHSWSAFGTRTGRTNQIVGDFNADGKADIAQYYPAESTWTISLANAAGNNFNTSNWRPSPLNPASSTLPKGNTIVWKTQIIGDFNGDHKADIANYDSGSGNWWVCLSNGSNFSTTKWATLPTPSSTYTPTSWTTQLVGDFNGDGRFDIANYHPNDRTWWVSLSNGAHFTTTKWATLSTTPHWTTQVVGDFNGDHKADIANFNSTDASWWVNLSNGATAFGAATNWTTLPSTVGWTSQLVGDFDHDGKADIANFRFGDASWWVSLSNGASAFTTSFRFKHTSAAPWNTSHMMHFVGDFNGDLKSDLADFEDLMFQKWWVNA